MREAVLALYLPIIAMAVPALWLFMTRLVIPALKHRPLDLDRYLIGLSASCGMAAHAIEQPFYWAVRTFPDAAWLNNQFALVAIMKMLILASAIFALAGLQRALANQAHLLRLTGIAGALWLAGFVLDKIDALEWLLERMGA